MKNTKKNTWIAIGCVALAILASQMYKAMQNESAGKEEVAVVSEIRPTASPITTPGIFKNEPVPKNESTPEPTPPAEASVPISAPAPSSSPIPSPKNFLLPATGEVHRPFSDTELVKFEPLGIWRCHLGIDFLPSENDIVFACAGGTVENIYEDPLYGTTVLLDHGNALKSYYSSLSAVSVEIGAAVLGGAEIGHMGETAPSEKGIHLHFAMEKDGKPMDPFERIE